MSTKGIICTLAGAAGGALCYLIGGWHSDILTLLVFMAIDFISGIIVAAVFKKSAKTENGALSSKESFRGICRKIEIIFFVVIGNMLDRYFGTNFLRSAVIVGFMANELISIVENAALMGVTSPAIENAIELLKKKSDKK